MSGGRYCPAKLLHSHPKKAQIRLSRISHQSHKPDAQARDGGRFTLAGASGLCQHTVMVSPSGEKCGLFAGMPPIGKLGFGNGQCARLADFALPNLF